MRCKDPSRHALRSRSADIARTGNLLVQFLFQRIILATRSDRLKHRLVIQVGLILFEIGMICSVLRISGHADVWRPVRCTEGLICQPYIF